MSQNPFLQYRERLDSYQAVRDGLISDSRFVEIVEELDSAVAEIDGGGFIRTPLVDGSALADAIGLDIELWIKAESDNVAGSHKARHLFGVALAMLIDEDLGAARPERLAIASCGNAALAAGVVAAAMKRSLDVYVPTWADPTIIERLTELGSNIHVSERRADEAGDPAYLRFREAVDGGATPFSVQGSDTPTTFDGGRTLGWELADQLGDIDRIYVQVGGGALATAVSSAVPAARLYPVQSEGCAPFRRAWDLLAPGFDIDEAAENPDRYMWAWDTEPKSLADGILDDVTYDWLPLLERTITSGGEPIVATEAHIELAYAMVHDATTLSVSATGTAGLAGLMTHPPSRHERVVVLFTGIDRA